MDGENMNTKDLEKTKKVINEIEDKVEEILKGTQEIRIEVSDWASPKILNGTKGTISEKALEITKKVDDEIQRLKPILKKIRESEK